MSEPELIQDIERTRPSKSTKKGACELTDIEGTSTMPPSVLYVCYSFILIFLRIPECEKMSASLILWPAIGTPFLLLSCIFYL